MESEDILVSVLELIKILKGSYSLFNLNKLNSKSKSMELIMKMTLF